MDKRVENFVTAILDEVITEGKSTKSEIVYKPTIDDYVFVNRGALTGESGTVKYVTPCKTMMDVQFDSGKYARVAIALCSKQKKK